MAHQWGSETVTKLLSKLREAIELGYSRLLIHDAVMAAKDPPIYMTTIDMTMLTIRGQERTLALHRQMVEAAGLKFVAIHNPGDGVSECVVEAEVV